MKKDKYDKSFKKKVVELYWAGISAKKLSQEYNVSDTSIYNWAKIFPKSISVSDKKNTRDTITTIQLENLRLRKEVEVLKKAMTIFLNDCRNEDKKN